MVQKYVVFVLPHLKVNTTSVSRFTSLFEALIEKEVPFHILEFEYPAKRVVSLAHETLSENFPIDIENRIIKIQPRLNVINKTGFYFLNNYQKPYWKFFNWLHQLFFGADIFYPGLPKKEVIQQLKGHLDGYVIACGGPFGIFNYAESIAAATNYKLLLDYRDPWTYGPKSVDSSSMIFFLKKLLKRKNEERLIQKAYAITTVSHSFRELFPLKFQSKIKVYQNGCNYMPEDVQPQPADIFNIVYSGTIYNEQLLDESFFKTLNRFRLSGAGFILHFLGAANNSYLIEILKKHDLLAVTNITKRLKKNELLNYYNQATAFLHFKYPSSNHIITTKQADYLFFGKPIILPVSDYGVIAKSIEENNAGFICHSADELFKVFEELYNSNQKNCIIHRPPNIELTRQNIAIRFIDEIILP